MDARCGRGRLTAGLLAALAGAVVVGGCSASRGASRKQSGSVVGIESFATAGAGGAAAPIAAAPAAGQAVKVIPEEVAAAGMTDLVATPGAAVAPTLASSVPAAVGAAPAGEAVLVDAKVGDVNGRAVYASAILDYGTAGITPIGPQLAAEARLRPRDSWRGWARGRIAETLVLLIRDELLRAEALQSFTPQQKQGFLGWMQKLQEDFVRERGGSVAQADRSLRDTEGITIDEWRRRQENDELVKFQLSQRILARVNVNYREIEQRYERERSRFDPPPTAVFRLAQVPLSKPDDVAAFTALLGTGVSFEEAAESPLNINRREQGGLETRELKGPRAEGDFFPNSLLNEAARTMKPGETVGPLQLSASVAWLHFEGEEDKDIDIYEAQLQLEDEIRKQRVERERDRYIASLQSKASITDAAEMVDRLAKIAEDRYFGARE